MNALAATVAVLCLFVAVYAITSRTGNLNLRKNVYPSLSLSEHNSCVRLQVGVWAGLSGSVHSNGRACIYFSNASSSYSFPDSIAWLDSNTITWRLEVSSLDILLYESPTLFYSLLGQPLSLTPFRPLVTTPSPAGPAVDAAATGPGGTFPSAPEHNSHLDTATQNTRKPWSLLFPEPLIYLPAEHQQRKSLQQPLMPSPPNSAGPHSRVSSPWRLRGQEVTKVEELRRGDKKARAAAAVAVAAAVAATVAIGVDENAAGVEGNENTGKYDEMNMIERTVESVITPAKRQSVGDAVAAGTASTVAVAAVAAGRPQGMIQLSSCRVLLPMHQEGMVCSALQAACRAAAAAILEGRRVSHFTRDSNSELNHETGDGGDPPSSATRPASSSASSIAGEVATCGQVVEERVKDTDLRLRAVQARASACDGDGGGGGGGGGPGDCVSGGSGGGSGSSASWVWELIPAGNAVRVASESLRWESGTPGGAESVAAAAPVAAVQASRTPYAADGEVVDTVKATAAANVSRSRDPLMEMVEEGIDMRGVVELQLKNLTFVCGSWPAVLAEMTAHTSRIAGPRPLPPATSAPPLHKQSWPLLLSAMRGQSTRISSSGQVTLTPALPAVKPCGLADARRDVDIGKGGDGGGADGCLLRSASADVSVRTAPGGERVLAASAEAAVAVAEPRRASYSTSFSVLLSSASSRTPPPPGQQQSLVHLLARTLGAADSVAASGGTTRDVDGGGRTADSPATDLQGPAASSRTSANAALAATAVSVVVLVVASLFMCTWIGKRRRQSQLSHHQHHRNRQAVLVTRMEGNPQIVALKPELTAPPLVVAIAAGGELAPSPEMAAASSAWQSTPSSLLLMPEGPRGLFSRFRSDHGGGTGLTADNINDTDGGSSSRGGGGGCCNTSALEAVTVGTTDTSSGAGRSGWIRPALLSTSSKLSSGRCSPRQAVVATADGGCAGGMAASVLATGATVPLALPLTAPPPAGMFHPHGPAEGLLPAQDIPECPEEEERQTVKGAGLYGCGGGAGGDGAAVVADLSASTRSDAVRSGAGRYGRRVSGGGVSLALYGGGGGDEEIGDGRGSGGTACVLTSFDTLPHCSSPRDYTAATGPDVAAAAVSASGSWYGNHWRGNGGGGGGADGGGIVDRAWHLQEALMANPALEAHGGLVAARDVIIDTNAVLGRGSYAVTYKGRWREVDVAVKVIAYDKGTSRKLQSEQLPCGTTCHPNVVSNHMHFFIQLPPPPLRLPSACASPSATTYSSSAGVAGSEPANAAAAAPAVAATSPLRLSPAGRKPIQSFQVSKLDPPLPAETVSGDLLYGFSSAMLSNQLPGHGTLFSKSIDGGSRTSERVSSPAATEAPLQPPPPASIQPKSLDLIGVNAGGGASRCEIGTTGGGGPETEVTAVEVVGAEVLRGISARQLYSMDPRPAALCMSASPAVVLHGNQLGHGDASLDNSSPSTNSKVMQSESSPPLPRWPEPTSTAEAAAMAGASESLDCSFVHSSTIISSGLLDCVSGSKPLPRPPQQRLRQWLPPPLQLPPPSGPAGMKPEAPSGCSLSYREILSPPPSTTTLPVSPHHQLRHLRPDPRPRTAGQSSCVAQEAAARWLLESWVCEAAGAAGSASGGATASLAMVTPVSLLADTASSSTIPSSGYVVPSIAEAVVSNRKPFLDHNRQTGIAYVARPLDPHVPPSPSLARRGEVAGFHRGGGRGTAAAAAAAPVLGATVGNLDVMQDQHKQRQSSSMQHLPNPFDQPIMFSSHCALKHLQLQSPVPPHVSTGGGGPTGYLTDTAAAKAVAAAVDQTRIDGGGQSIPWVPDECPSVDIHGEGSLQQQRRRQYDIASVMHSLPLHTLGGFTASSLYEAVSADLTSSGSRIASGKLFDNAVAALIAAAAASDSSGGGGAAQPPPQPGRKIMYHDDTQPVAGRGGGGGGGARATSGGIPASTFSGLLLALVSERGSNSSALGIELGVVDGLPGGIASVETSKLGLDDFLDRMAAASSAPSSYMGVSWSEVAAAAAAHAASMAAVTGVPVPITTSNSYTAHSISPLFTEALSHRSTNSPSSIETIHTANPSSCTTMSAAVQNLPPPSVGPAKQLRYSLVTPSAPNAAAANLSVAATTFGTLGAEVTGRRTLPDCGEDDGDGEHGDGRDWTGGSGRQVTAVTPREAAVSLSRTVSATRHRGVTVTVITPAAPIVAVAAHSGGSSVSWRGGAGTTLHTNREDARGPVLCHDLITRGPPTSTLDPCVGTTVHTYREDQGAALQGGRGRLWPLPSVASAVTILDPPLPLSPESPYTMYDISNLAATAVAAAPRDVSETASQASTSMMLPVPYHHSDRTTERAWSIGTGGSARSLTAVISAATASSSARMRTLHGRQRWSYSFHPRPTGEPRPRSRLCLQTVGELLLSQSVNAASAAVTYGSPPTTATRRRWSVLGPGFPDLVSSVDEYGSIDRYGNSEGTNTDDDGGGGSESNNVDHTNYDGHPATATFATAATAASASAVATASTSPSPRSNECTTMLDVQSDPSLPTTGPATHRAAYDNRDGVAILVAQPDHNIVFTNMNRIDQTNSTSTDDVQTMHPLTSRDCGSRCGPFVDTTAADAATAVFAIAADSSAGSLPVEHLGPLISGNAGAAALVSPGSGTAIRGTSSDDGTAAIDTNAVPEISATQTQPPQQRPSLVPSSSLGSSVGEVNLSFDPWNVRQYMMTDGSNGAGAGNLTTSTAVRVTSLGSGGSGGGGSVGGLLSYITCASPSQSTRLISPPLAATTAITATTATAAAGVPATFASTRADVTTAPLGAVLSWLVPGHSPGNVADEGGDGGGDGAAAIAVAAPFPASASNSDSLPADATFSAPLCSTIVLDGSVPHANVSMAAVGDDSDGGLPRFVDSALQQLYGRFAGGSDKELTSVVVKMPSQHDADAYELLGGGGGGGGGGGTSKDEDGCGGSRMSSAGGALRHVMAPLPRPLPLPPPPSCLPSSYVRQDLELPLNALVQNPGGGYGGHGSVGNRNRTSACGFGTGGSHVGAYLAAPDVAAVVPGSRAPTRNQELLQLVTRGRSRTDSCQLQPSDSSSDNGSTAKGSFSHTPIESSPKPAATAVVSDSGRRQPSVPSPPSRRMASPSLSYGMMRMVTVGDSDGDFGGGSSFRRPSYLSLLATGNSDLYDVPEVSPLSYNADVQGSQKDDTGAGAANRRGGGGGSGDSTPAAALVHKSFDIKMLPLLMYDNQRPRRRAQSSEQGRDRTVIATTAAAATTDTKAHPRSISGASPHVMPLMIPLRGLQSTPTPPPPPPQTLTQRPLSSTSEPVAKTIVAAPAAAVAAPGHWPSYTCGSGRFASPWVGPSGGSVKPPGELSRYMQSSGGLIPWSPQLPPLSFGAPYHSSQASESASRIQSRLAATAMTVVPEGAAVQCSSTTPASYGSLLQSDSSHSPLDEPLAPTAAAGSRTAAERTSGLPAVLWLQSALAPGGIGSLSIMVSELAPFGSLLHLRSRLGPPDGPIDLRVFLDLSRQVARGLAHLHSRRLVHGDLRASNVLIGPDPEGLHGVRAMVCDYGYSRLLLTGRQTLQPRPHCAPTHLAPESWAEVATTRAADIFAFGMLMWELAVGYPPWSGLSLSELLSRVVLEDLRPPLPDWLPRGLVQLVQACWSRRPRSRPDVAGIVQWLDELFMELPPLPLPPPMSLWLLLAPCLSTPQPQPQLQHLHEPGMMPLPFSRGGSAVARGHCGSGGSNGEPPDSNSDAAAAAATAAVVVGGGGHSGGVVVTAAAPPSPMVDHMMSADRNHLHNQVPSYQWQSYPRDLYKLPDNGVQQPSVSSTATAAASVSQRVGSPPPGGALLSTHILGVPPPLLQSQQRKHSNRLEYRTAIPSVSAAAAAAVTNGWGVPRLPIDSERPAFIAIEM